jgi:hypothetical protein
MGSRTKVKIDPTGKGSDAIDATVPSDKIEKRAIPGIIDSFRQQIQHLLLIVKHIGPATAAAAGRTAVHAYFTIAKGMLKYTTTEIVCRPIKEGYPTPIITPRTFVPDHSPL